VWHCIAGVKLHHSLNHALCHPKFLAPPKWRCGHPTGHPKLLQLETPLQTSNKSLTVSLDWIDIIVISECVSGRWSCTKDVCSKTCSVLGFQHFKTFDGKTYEFHGPECSFVLVEVSLLLCQLCCRRLRDKEWPNNVELTRCLEIFSTASGTREREWPRGTGGTTAHQRDRTPRSNVCSSGSPSPFLRSLPRA